MLKRISVGEWKRMPELDRLIIVRALRPERLTAALSRFVAAAIGSQYITSQPFSLERSFQVSNLLYLKATGLVAWTKAGTSKPKEATKHSIA